MKTTLSTQNPCSAEANIWTGRSNHTNLTIVKKSNPDMLSTEQNDISTLEEQNEELLSSIHYAKRLQQAILPSAESMNKVVGEHFVLNKPKDIVSGDFYFVESIPASTGRNLAAFSVVDCTGHGVPGALMSMLSYGILKGSLNERTINSAGETLDHLNHNISHAFHANTTDSKVRDGMDISFCVLDKDTKVLEFAGANSKGLVIKKDGSAQELIPNKHAIGYDEHTIRFETSFIQLEKGDTVYLFSDGFKDQFGGMNGKKLGYKNFIAKLTEVSKKNMNEQKELLESFFNAWKGELSQLDDVTVLGVRI